MASNHPLNAMIPEGGIIRRRSLLFPIIGLLVLIVFFSMGVGYLINYPFLYQSLHNKAKIEHEAQVAQIGFLVEHESNSLLQLANVMSRDGELQEAFTHQAQDFNRLMRKVLFLSETIDGVNFVGVTDATGKMLYSTNDGVSETEFPQEAMQKLLKGGSTLLSLPLNREWSILALAPIMVQRQTVGILFLGLWINKDMAKRLTPKISSGLAFATSDFMASSFDLNEWLPVDPDHIQTCVTKNLPVTSMIESFNRGIHYAPLPIVDNTFCLILPLDFNPIHNTLRDHVIRLGWSSIIIILMIVFLGFALHFLILKPLHRLRNKALILVEVCSHQDIVLPDIMNVTKGNEIHVLDQAFETASAAIYAYISELSHQKERFEVMAIRDPLTGLGNRRLFTQLVEKALAICHRYQRSMAVMYLDLDHFKPVNDTLGHDIGDLLLKEVAMRLQVALRESDVVFRLGGDEFAALLPECAGGEVARNLGERLIQDVARPYLLNGHDCVIGVSVGVALYPDHADSLEKLLKHADIALYAAKDAGRGVCRLYNDLG